MVHPKAGSYGAVAQNARKKQKEASTMGKVSAPKKAPPPPSAGKKKIVSKSQEKPQTAEEIRKGNELILFGKLIEQGKDPALLPLDVMNKMLDQMAADEKSGEQYSDEVEEEKAVEKKTDEEIKLHRKRKDQEIDRRPITDQKMLQKYKVDREDYKLQYAYVDERPVYLDIYQKDLVICFDRYNHKGPDNPEITLITARIFQLSNDVLSRVDPQKADHLPEVFRMADDYRRTAPHTNICVNPLQVLRGWGLLSTLAQRKTADDLNVLLNYHLNRGRLNRTTAEHELLALHYDTEVVFDGAVRLFTEIPRHLPLKEDDRNSTNLYYGGKSKRAAIQHHSFATDSDGFYSCYRINQEMALSTHGNLRYVVPENHAPNWRASVAVATGMDCTFYWETEKDPMPIEADNFRFDGGKYGLSKCSGILAKAKVWQGDGMYRFEGQHSGIHLFIIPEDPKNIDKEKSIDKSLFPKLNNYWDMTTKTVLLPKCTTSTPLSLYNYAKHSGLSRLFSSEKSELRHLASSGFDASSSPQFTTLFDHYHKTSFEICASKPNEMDFQRKFDELAPARAHQCVDETMAKNFGKFQIKEASLMPTLFTYYEDHLCQDPSVFSKIDSETKFADEKGVELNLARPFYFILARSLGNQPYFPICTGYFNNTVWVIRD